MFRLAVAASVVLFWCQFLLTARWADVDGALHGAKRPWYVLALIATSIALLTWRRAGRPVAGRDTLLAGLAGLATIAVGVWIWFPPTVWSAIPYLDNWATRFQSSIDAIELLKQGSATGWNWYFLGGYPLATDITQHLGLLSYLPVSIFGPAIGFHLLHVVLLFAIPLLVLADLRLSGERGGAWLAMGLVCATVAGLSYPLFRSGDTNSLAGVCLTMAVVVSSHAARLGRRWGGPLLVVSLAALAWSHVGFLIYAVLLVGLDLVLARAWRSIGLVALGVVTALVASLPLTWELWRYPSLFLANNVRFDPDAPIVWSALARQMFYNLELSWLPGRWPNDYVGLSRVLLPVLVWAAIACRRQRMGFYAAGALAMMGLLLFNAAEFGYVFQRPVHLLSVLTPVALAGALLEGGAAPWRRAIVVVFLFVYIQAWWRPVPHIDGLHEVEPIVAANVAQSRGALVLVENTFHRDMDRSPERRSEPTPIPVHLERMLSLATGKRFYAGMWDGMQWVPYRERLLSGGTFHGAPIAETPYGAFFEEMRRWGVEDLVVWSEGARRYLDAAPGVVPTWSDGPWHAYRIENADVRSVATTTGSGALDELTPFGAVVRLDGGVAGEPVIVRTSFHPSWSAEVDGEPVPLVDRNGQLSFTAPRDGSVTVRLVFPKRTGLLWLAAIVTILAAALAGRVAAPPAESARSAVPRRS